MNKKGLLGEFIKYWECGQQKVTGRVNAVITLCLVVATYLQLKHFPLFWWQFILLALGLACIILLAGFLYVHFNIYKLEQGTLQRENPEMMEIKKDIKHCLELLGEKK